MMRLLAATLLLATACTVHHHHHHVAAPAPQAAPVAVAPKTPAPAQDAPAPVAAPAAPPAAPVAAAPAPAPRLRTFVELGRSGEAGSIAEREAASAELAARFTPAKQFLIANKATHKFHTAYLGRVGRPGELAPILEVPGGGFVLGLHRNLSATGSDQHPEVVRLDAAGNVLWRLALPTPRGFNTFEVRGALLAPDGTVVVLTTPYARNDPRAAMLAKVTLDGRLVWSMQLAQDVRRVDGPFVFDLTFAADGTIRLVGVVQRDRTGADVRDWSGTVSAAGRQLSDAPGPGMTWTVDNVPQTAAIFPFWYDLYHPAYPSR